VIRRSLEGLEDGPARTLIIGSGPAGLTLAMELARRGLPSTIMESGDMGAGPAQELSSARIVDPSQHDDMSIAVSRRLGGASNLWGGRCMRLDPVDFEPRAYAKQSRWPLDFAEIEPWYDHACRYANCGDPVFDCPIRDVRVADDQFTMSNIERSSNKPAFQRAHGELLSSSALIDIRIGATVVDMKPLENGRISQVGVVGGDGRRRRVRIGRVVVAAGGLESTRLLLALQRRHAGLFAGPEGPLGRFYMGHIIGEIADVVFADERFDAAFDFALDGHGSWVRRRFIPSAQTQTRHSLPNLSFWPVVPPIADARHGSGPLSAVTLALASPVLGRRLVAEAIRKRHLSGSVDWVAHAGNIGADIPRTIGFLGQFVYRRYLSQHRISGYFVRNRARRYGLAYSSEQSPRADSRVTLSNEADRLGLPRLNVDYRCHREDAEAVARAHSVLGNWLEKNGVGRLEYRQSEAANVDAVAAKMGHGTHQIGTARMGFSRHDGVVDHDLRTFDCPNLFVLSSAVFPTSGQANPTLSIVALAARLAETLAHEGVPASGGLEMAAAHA
jgi:choline dehydrogenase-like flavoprotein